MNFTEGISVNGVDIRKQLFLQQPIVNSGEYGIEVGTFGENAANNERFIRTP